MSEPTRHAALLETGGSPVHIVMHRDPGAMPRDTAVVLLPPFGWDDVCSYRPRREWADALAAAGFLAVRLSYPAAGDSGGTPDDPGLLDAWSDSLVVAVARLRETDARPRLALIGIELGGIVACRAIARGLAVDDLVLWGTPATGRQFVRRLQAFSNLEATTDDSALDPVPDGSQGLAAGGFRLAPETLEHLQGFDVARLDGLGAAIGRALVLGRDQLAPDNRLSTHLADTGAEVTRLAGNGYSAMTAPSFEATTPQATIDGVTGWLSLAAAALPGAADGADLPPGPVAVGLPGEQVVRESQLRLEGPNGVLAGVLTEAADPEPGGLCVIYLDTGTIRCIGPNRMWVEAARRWATHGVRSLRFDMDGMGDSDGDPEPYRDLSKLYDPWIIAQLTAVMDQLHAQGLGDRFAIVGLSSGAYWALQAGLAREWVCGIAMMNPGALVWDPGTSPLGDFRTMRTIAQTRSISLATLRKALGPRGLALAVWLVRAVFERLLRRGEAQPMLVGEDDELRAAVADLEAMAARRLLVFCEDEPSLLIITALGLIDGLYATPGVEIARIGTRDHTVRPLWAQRDVHAALDRWLEQLMS